MSLFDDLLDVLGLNRTERKKSAKSASADPKSAADAKPKTAETLNLDASDLLPITSDELRMSLQQLIRSGQWRFSWRGTIPVGDERTRLINRALLSNNLLTPEQLDEIISAANEHEQIQKLEVLYGDRGEKAGEAAVQADKEARQALKLQKKAEADERQRLHAEAVAHRRATDIFFLGSGVSHRLHDRTCEPDKLAGPGLPVLSTPQELAEAIGIDVPKLRWLAYHTEVASRIHYVHFEIPKRSGGVRVLSAPHRQLAQAQQWIFNEILKKLVPQPQAHGFVSGRSILTNASPHTGKAVVLNMDLEGFFPSISWVRVRALFQRIGYGGSVATILALLCTECPREAVEYAGQVYYVATGQRGLPQGACTSPALSNLISARLDKRINGLANKLGLTYTRYADDITISGPSEFNERVGYVMACVRHIAQDCGFAINHKKTRILRKNTAQEVTGIVVNEKPNLSRSELRRLRAILHRARHEGLDAQNREGRKHFRAWLHGKIAFVNMVRPDLGAKMLAQFQELTGDV